MQNVHKKAYLELPKLKRLPNANRNEVTKEREHARSLSGDRALVVRDSRGPCLSETYYLPVFCWGYRRDRATVFFSGWWGMGEVYRNVRLCTVMSEQRVAPNFWLNVGGNGIEKVKSEELCRAFRERTG